MAVYKLGVLVVHLITIVINNNLDIINSSNNNNLITMSTVTVTNAEPLFKICIARNVSLSKQRNWKL